MKGHLVAAGAVLAMAALPAQAQSKAAPGDIRAGREFAMVHCSECHVVVHRLGSPRRVGGPPDFTDVAGMPGMTRTALLAFLRSPHPTMPDLILSERQANDVIAYILSLQPPENP